MKRWLLALALIGAIPALAVEDRDNTSQTGWAWYFSQTEAQVASLINTYGFRIVDLKVENPTSVSKTFTVAFVSNAGSFARTWYWNYDQTSTDAFNFAVNNNLRPIVLQAYETSPGVVRFATVWILNTGVYAKGWWFYPALALADITPTCLANSARLTQISRYRTGGQTYYAVLMIPNTGADYRIWAWYTGETGAQLVADVGALNGRVTDLDYDGPTNTFSSIMESCGLGCPQWFYYALLTVAEVDAYVDQDTARIADISPCGADCFSVVLLTDTDPVTARVGAMLRAGTAGTGATTGVYLKSVGGPVLAAMNEKYVHDPASAIKIGPAVYAMAKVQAGAHLSDLVSHITDAPSSCPNPAHVSGTETIQTAIQEMMRHSDNARTLEIVDWDGGNAVVNGYMQNTVGMADSSINQVLGCTGPGSTYTVADGGLIYESIVNGTLLALPEIVSLFSMMAGKAEAAAEGYDFTHIWDTDFPAIVLGEAPAQFDGANINWWFDHANVAYKAGGSQSCFACSDVIENIAVTGWASLPFCSGLTIDSHQFVFGSFISNAEDTSYYAGKTTLADQTFASTKSEILREEIRASLRSCLHGDANHDAKIDITDVFWEINYLFAGGPAPLGWADIDGNLTVDIADVFYTINYLFAGGTPPH